MNNLRTMTNPYATDAQKAAAKSRLDGSGALLALKYAMQMYDYYNKLGSDQYMVFDQNGKRIMSDPVTFDEMRAPMDANYDTVKQFLDAYNKYDANTSYSMRKLLGVNDMAYFDNNTPIRDNTASTDDRAQFRQIYQDAMRQPTILGMLLTGFQMGSDDFFNIIAGAGNVFSYLSGSEFRIPYATSNYDAFHQTLAIIRAKQFSGQAGSYQLGVDAIRLLTLLAMTVPTAISGVKLVKNGLGALKDAVIGIDAIDAADIAASAADAIDTADTADDLTDGTGNSIIKGGIDTAGNLDSINQYFKKSQFVTEPNTAYFWSGMGEDGSSTAAAIASKNGGVTLESVIETQGIQMPKWDFDDSASIQAWKDASLYYAEQASGEVKAVIGPGLSQSSVWNTIELPALKANPFITKITLIDPNTLAETIIFTR